MASTSSEERKIEEPAKEMAHRTKVIQFLGRTTPIILQNDNGPCPLLAICNVLLLKNQLNLSPDIAEVSQENLLSLVVERLIDSNSNVNNKDAGFVENQQQNIADAIDLLPQLTTGIDVNIKFRRIDDFEFTPECAIFDLLDIPLYHGWIVVPEDYDTSNAIGSKSYNALMGELVALETLNMDDGDEKNAEEDDVDFVAATTAALGVPSPCSRGQSFDDSSLSISSQQTARKGDIEEEAELLRILKLSEAEVQNSTPEASAVNINEQNLSVSADERVCLSKSEPVNVVETLEESGSACQKSDQHEASASSDCNDMIICNNDLVSEIVLSEGSSSLNVDQRNPDNDLASKDSRGRASCKEVDDQTSSNLTVENGSTISGTCGEDPSSSSESLVHIPEEDVQIQRKLTLMTDTNEPETNQGDCDMLGVTTLLIPSADSDSPSGQRIFFDEPKVFTPSVDGSEPIYEGEERISGPTVYEDREPMYEGEVVLAEQVDKSGMDADTNSKDEITPRQGELIRNFLKNSGNQLTIYGLFCLQDGLKERELCVFFRNNHFNTMFKFEGELYILATDQGYINQHDLVWEKLNEVNGDTLYMTGNFKEFKVEDHLNKPWDEQNARDYLASIDNSEHAQASFNSDLQLAIALQQQEFEGQSQCTVQQPEVTVSSRLVTGPQVPRRNIRNSSSSVKQDTKPSKDKCVIL